MGKLQDKVAIVTGATAGIGVGIVNVFLKEGAKVCFAARRADKGKELEAAWRAEGYDVTFVQTDMTDDAAVQNLFDQTVKVYGRVDVLVNNAGMLKMAPMVQADIAKDWDDVFALNLRSYYVSCKIAAGLMAPGSAIVNIASIGALSGCPNLASYGASKAGVVSLTKTLGNELAGMGIRTNAVLPGTIFSEMMPRDSEFTDYALSLIPMKRGGEPEEIGTAVAFLASDEASFICGATLVVDGGAAAC